jgi:hypothetical protein
MGKRHHYIPQMLLKNFRSKTDEWGKKHWLYQISKDGHVIETTTSNVALEKYFYGKEDEVENLLTNIEGEADQILKSIIRGTDPNEFSKPLHRFLWLHSLRTRAAKLAILQAFSSAIGSFLASATKTNLAERITSRILYDFENIVTKELPLRPPSEQIVFEELMKTPGFTRIAQEALIGMVIKENVVSIIQRLFASIGVSGIVEESMRVGHQAAIEKLVRNPQSPPSFHFENWQVQKFSEVGLVLGDICTFAIYDDGSIGSFAKFDEQNKRTKYVVMPIATDTLLIGSNQTEATHFSADDINIASASLSWDYVYCNSSEHHYLKLSDAIATVEPIIDESEIREIVRKSWLT